MRDLQEIFEHWQAGDTLRAMERNLGVDRQTLRKYLMIAQDAGIRRDSPMTPEAWHIWIRDTFPGARGGQPTAKMAILTPHREWIENALQTNHVSTVWQRLCEQTRIDVSLSTFRRYCTTLAVPPRGPRGPGGFRQDGAVGRDPNVVRLSTQEHMCDEQVYSKSDS